MVGYGVGVLLYLGTAPFLIRHLGVEEFGGYVAVLALIGIVSLVSDAGLTLVGVREYAVRDHGARVSLIANLFSLRLILVAAGVAVATAFAAISGYPAELVAGTALAGMGLLLLVVYQTYSVVLTSELRFGTVTVLEVGRQALTAAGILTLIAVGAGVTSLLAVSIPVAALLALATAVALHGSPIRPGLRRAEVRYLVREALPVAVASAIGSFFYRSAVVVMSITATQAETSYFSASYRVLESVIHIPGLLCATAFPILARAAADDEDRTAHALQRLADIGLILGTAAALTLALAARPLISFLAGDGFEPSVAVLQVQAAALPATFLVSVWATGLWAVRGQRGLAIANAIGVTLAVTLAAVAGALEGALGVAVTMLFSECVLAALYLRALVRLRPSLRPKAAVAVKVFAAGAVALLSALLPVPELVRAGIALVVYALILLRLRAIPSDVWRAFLELRRTSPAVSP